MRELPVELYRAAQVRELDRIAIAERGIPGYTLMSRAGEAACQLLGQRWSKARRIVVVCGGGNNGGDGYVVARLARQAGCDVRGWRSPTRPHCAATRKPPGGMPAPRRS